MGPGSCSIGVWAPLQSPEALPPLEMRTKNKQSTEKPISFLSSGVEKHMLIFLTSLLTTTYIQSSSIKYQHVAEEQ